MDDMKRKYLRLPPSLQKPIAVVFRKEGLDHLASRTKVTDISIGGLGLDIPDAESIFQHGMLIERIELSLPEEDTCVVSGTVVFLQGRKCGIEFVHQIESQISKISRYIFKREIELLNIFENKRVVPSSENPVRVVLRLGETEYFSPRIDVIDVGISGLRLEISGAEADINPGTPIEVIEVSIPEEDTCVLSGKVSDRIGRRYDIEFDQSQRAELYTIRRYIYMREIEIQEAGPEDLMMNEAKRIGTIKDSVTEKKKILIVDDSASVQDEYSGFLFEQGFVVLQSKDGAEGIKVALSMFPDLILMDVNMPVLSGLESTRIIKNHPSTRDIPVLMFTTEGEKGAVVKAIQAGAKDYIIKTMDKKFVLERIERFLRGDK
jgi:CheY-like chemotaxis protein